MGKRRGQKQQFEVGKKYHRELPSEWLMKLSEKKYKIPYKKSKVYEVVKRTRCYVTLKDNDRVFRKKIDVEPVWRKQYDDYKDSTEFCFVGFYGDEIIRADQFYKEENS